MARAKAIRIVRWVCSPAGAIYVLLVIGAGLGIAADATGGGFVLLWWTPTVVAALAGWLLLSWLLAGDEEETVTLLRHLACAASPLLLLTSECAQAAWKLPTTWLLLLQSLAYGGVAGLVAFFWGDFVSERTPGWLRRLVTSPHTIVVLAVLWGCLYTTLAGVRWWNFDHTSNDQGIWEQSFYKVLNGGGLECTPSAPFFPPGTRMNILGDHFSPIVLAVLPLYALWQTPLWLMALLAFVPAWGAVGVARLAGRWYGSSAAGLVFGCVWLLAPGLHAGVLSDFHPEVLAAAFVIWGLYLGLERRYLLSALVLLGALACKENLPATVVMVGLYLALKGGRRFGFGVVAGAIVCGVLAMTVVLPSLSPTHSYLHYGFLGDSPAAALWNDSGQAGIYLTRRLSYIGEIIGPVCGLCLLSPATLALSLPELVFHLVSASRDMIVISLHYHVTIMVGIILGGIATLTAARRKLVLRFASAHAGRRALISAALLVGFAVGSFSILKHGENLFTEISGDSFRLSDATIPAVHRMLAKIPRTASVLVNSGGLASNLSARPLIILYNAPENVTPMMFEKRALVDYIVMQAKLTERGAQALAREHGLRLLDHAGWYWLWAVDHAAQPKAVLPRGFSPPRPPSGGWVRAKPWPQVNYWSAE